MAVLEQRPLESWKSGSGAKMYDTTAATGDDGDEGPFIDLVFTVPVAADDSVAKDSSASETESESEEGCRRASGRRLSLSHADDLFFKGRLFPVETSSSFVFNSSEPNPKPLFPAALLRSATKLRLFLNPKARRPKSLSSDPNVASPAASTASSKQQGSKFFVKFRVEEVPLVSLFTRDSSSSRSARSHADDALPASEEKKFSKDLVHKYLNKIKPLYFRVSKRYGEKIRFSGPLGSGGTAKVGSADACERESAAPATAATAKTGKFPAGLKVVGRRLRKSRSASSAVAAVRSPPAMPRQRDDSLVEQQDGIQSAILHCKRSFNADKIKAFESPLVRSRSDPGDGRIADGKAHLV